MAERRKAELAARTVAGGADVGPPGALERILPMEIALQHDEADRPRKERAKAERAKAASEQTTKMTTHTLHGGRASLGSAQLSSVFKFQFEVPLECFCVV